MLIHAYYAPKRNNLFYKIVKFMYKGSSTSSCASTYSMKKVFESDEIDKEGANVSKKLKIYKYSSLTNFFSLKTTYNSYKGLLEIKGDGVWKYPLIKISSWNVNGLRAQLRRNDLYNYLAYSDPDIFCMNETKVDEIKFKEEVDSSYFPPTYHQYYNFCKPPFKGYSGVSIFSKVAPISVRHDLGDEELDKEGRLLTVEYEKFYLVASYIPNAGNGLVRLDFKMQKYLPAVLRFLNTLKEKKGVVWVGDLNIAHYDIDIYDPASGENAPGFTKQERDFFTNLLSQGYTDTFRHLYADKVQYSWWNYRTKARGTNKGWRIDYAILSNEMLDKLYDSTIYDQVMGSDHAPIELYLKF